MRFVFVYYDRPNYYGGPIINARRLLPELHRRGHEVHCLIFYGGDGFASVEYLEHHGVICHSRPLIGYTESHIKWILRLVFELKPDIFVPNLLVSGWFAARWVREAGIPSVAVMRSDDPFHWAMVDQFVTGPSEWAVSGLVCVSEGLCQRVRQRVPEHTKLTVIPSGVPIPDKSSSQEGPLKLVYVGRLVQEAKRILDLVDALALTIRNYPDISATLIGGGDKLPEVQQRINHYMLRDRIKVIDCIPSEKIQNTLADYDVIVLLSDYEGAPGAVMDGMAVGLVPICLDIPGGVRELVIHEKTGLLAQDRGDDFVRSVDRLACDETLRRNLSINAREHIKKHFSLEVAADRWEAFSIKLVDGISHRSSFIIPRSLSLPPIRPELAREDKRRIPLFKRVIMAIIRFLRGGNSICARIF